MMNLTRKTRIATSFRLILLLFFVISTYLLFLPVSLYDKYNFTESSNVNTAITQPNRINLHPPNDFIFGAATASYQIEGAIYVDGREQSIWDTFVSLPNKIHNNETATIATNSYYLYDKDIEILKQLGATHYRFSLSWPRILPDGTTINFKGLLYYSNLIKLLKSNNIEPMITIYHWDMPQKVYDITNGGWINSTIIKYYLKYVKVVFDYLANYQHNVTLWTTFNEPFSHCTQGYLFGTAAPGRCGKLNNDEYKQNPKQFCPIGGDSIQEPYLCGHYMLLAHAYAVQLFRKSEYNYNLNGMSKIGINLDVAGAFAANYSNLK